ncbi:MAG: ABC transporter substrate-binding protein [Lachnospiraceae bacterium]|nr:ABC transporter substrate-binding protein [Lachnospiraceae bacterium]
MRKKLLAALLGVSMVAALFAGCGSSKKSSSSSKDSSSSSGEVDLTFPCIWVGTDSKAEGFKKIVDGFNSENEGKYHITIKDYTDYDAYADYIRTSISSGDAPDLFSVKTKADVELYSQSGKVLDLTDFLSGDDMKSKYSDGVLKNEQVDGKNYALPWEAAVVPVIWNGSLLEKAGITDLPTTTDEYIETFDKLKASGVSTPASFMTASNAWTAMLWYTYALGEKGGADAISGKWNENDFIDAANWLKEVYGYAPSDAIGAQAKDVNAHFFNQETAVYTNGTWILSNIQQNAADGVYDNLKFSAGPGNTIIQYTQAYILSGAVKDKAKQKAVEAFMTYVTDADRLTELSNSSGSVFVPKENTVDNAYVSEILKLRDSAKVLIPSFESSVSTTCANDLSPQLESFLSGSIDAKTFVETLKADNEE